jgi:hypothetical protein
MDNPASDEQSSKSMPTFPVEGFRIWNPFPYGISIDSKNFIGREREVKRIYKRLQNKNDLDNISIVGERRIGKTSLLKYISHPDTIRKFGYDPDSYIFVFVAIDSYEESATPDDFWRDVLKQIGDRSKRDLVREIVTKVAIKPSFIARELGDLFDEIGQQGQGVVLLLDEFDGLNKNFDINFRDSLFSLGSNHNLALVTASRRMLTELPYYKKPTEFTKNPFFKNLETIELDLLSQDEAKELIENNIKDTSIIFNENEEQYLMQLAGYHPYFIQMAGYFLFDSYSSKKDLTYQKRLDDVQRQLQNEMKYYLADFWDNSTEEEKWVLVTLSNLQSDTAKTEYFDKVELYKHLNVSASVGNNLLRKLVRRCLLIERNEYYSLFSPMFYKWIKRNFKTTPKISKPVIIKPTLKNLHIPDIHILHISDIHLGSKEDVMPHLVCLDNDLGKELNISNLKYLIISGDITNYSTPNEYDAAQLFLKEIMSRYSIDPEHIIVTPGNHDLNWDISEQAYSFVWNRKVKNKGFPPSGKFIPAGKIGILELSDEVVYQKRFSNFNDHFYSPLLGKPYPIEYDKQGVLQQYPDDRLLFLSLNSAWNIDHYYQERSGVNLGALASALDRLRGDKFKDWLKIAVWHHPVTGWKRMMDVDFLELLAINGFEICLHGHLHKAVDDFYRYDEKRGLHILGAGTFGAPAPEQEPGIPLQYNLLSFDPQKGKIVIQWRKRETQSSAWKADRRENDHSSRSFTLKKYSFSQ